MSDLCSSDLLASSDTLNVSVWARFAQPSRLVWAASDAIAEDIAKAVASAAPALLEAARPTIGDRLAPLDLWSIAFGLPYNADLRAERRLRAGSIVEHAPDRHLRFTPPALRSHRNSGVKGTRVSVRLDPGDRTNIQK